jgi:hypothetical protein
MREPVDASKIFIQARTDSSYMRRNLTIELVFTLPDSPRIIVMADNVTSDDFRPDIWNATSSTHLPYEDVAGLLDEVFAAALRPEVLYGEGRYNLFEAQLIWQNYEIPELGKSGRLEFQALCDLLTAEEFRQVGKQHGVTLHCRPMAIYDIVEAWLTKLSQANPAISYPKRRYPQAKHL